MSGGKATQPTWLAHFPALLSITDPHWLAAAKAAHESTLPARTVVFRDGDPCHNYLLVTEGSVRVQKISESGKEIVLYRVEAGQSCVLTTSCLLADDRYLAEAITETEVKAVVIPGAPFHDALAHSPGFRRFVFHAYGRRMATLMALVEALAFERMDTRLARRLLDKSAEQREIIVTHHELAADLGSAREVISRLLKDFEHHGWIRLHRGRIEILDPGALQRIEERA